MKMYRLKNQRDEYNDYVCLHCKCEFTSCDVSQWNLCPLCGVQWTGEFTKKRTKYPEKISDWRNLGYKMESGIIVQSDEKRLMVEIGRIMTSKLSVAGFFSVPCQQYVQWSLYSHTTVGWSNSKSAFVDMFERYQQATRSHMHQMVRLRFLYGTESRIIKEYKRRSHDRDSNDNTESRQDCVVAASGC